MPVTHNHCLGARLDNLSACNAAGRSFIRNGWGGSAGTPVFCEELVLEDPSGYSADAQLKVVQRPIGQNDIGIVAWVLTLRSPECPTGRKVSRVCLLLPQPDSLL